MSATNRRAWEFRIALVDDYESVYAAVKRMAESENWGVEYYSNGLEALQQVPRTRPNVVLIDIEMPGLSGIDCAQKLKCLMPSLPIIMLAERSDFESTIRSLMAGAEGCLLKPLSPEEFRNAIPSVIDGGIAFCEMAQTALVSCLREAFTSTSAPAFSERERQVMACLMQNMCDKEIGRHLKIETNTVHVHMVHLFQRLGVHSRREAVLEFFKRCLETSCSHCAGWRPGPVSSGRPSSSRMVHPCLPVPARTGWSAVLSAGRGGSTAGRPALEKLCRTYWYPVYVCVRRRGNSAQDAQEVIQEFFAGLLEGKWVERGEAQNGRFRSFLLSAMDRFLADKRDKARTLKRGDGAAPLGMEFKRAETRYRNERADQATPEQNYERHWALALLEEVLRRLREEYEQENRAEVFAELNPCLVGERSSQAYAELAVRLGASEGTVRSAVYRLRQRYRQLLREEIAGTVAEPGEADEELQHLFIVLGSR